MYWVVKEPVGLNYYRFHEEEYAILNMLDGDTSLQAIKRFRTKFAPQRITLQDLQQFVGMLHRSGLVISQSPVRAVNFDAAATEKKTKELLGKVPMSLLCAFAASIPNEYSTSTPLPGGSSAGGPFVGRYLGSALTLVLVKWESSNQVADL